MDTHRHAHSHTPTPMHSITYTHTHSPANMHMHTLTHIDSHTGERATCRWDRVLIRMCAVCEEVSVLNSRCGGEAYRPGEPGSPPSSALLLPTLPPGLSSLHLEGTASHRQSACPWPGQKPGVIHSLECVWGLCEDSLGERLNPQHTWGTPKPA